MTGIIIQDNIHIPDNPPDKPAFGSLDVFMPNGNSTGQLCNHPQTIFNSCAPSFFQNVAREKYTTLLLGFILICDYGAQESPDTSLQS